MQHGIADMSEKVLYAPSKLVMLRDDQGISIMGMFALQMVMYTLHSWKFYPGIIWNDQTPGSKREKKSDILSGNQTWQREILELNGSL